MSLVHAALCGLLLAGAGAPAAAQLGVSVSDTGVVQVRVGETSCLEQFQVILPAPDWRGGASPTDCSRETVGPGHERVSGTMSDGAPCATFILDSLLDGPTLELTWALTFVRDYDAETVRLNGLLPCEVSAGKAAWFVRRPDQLQWALFPAAYGEPGGSLSDWGFDWFGWLLPGDRGIRFRPVSGLRDMYLQDGRQWGDHCFQVCWTLVGRGTIREGTVLRCGIRLEPLHGVDVARDADRLSMALLAAQPTLTENPLQGAHGRIEVRNVRAEAQSVDLTWQVTDDIGAVLAQGRKPLAAPALGAAGVTLSIPPTPSGDYRLRAQVQPSAGGPGVTGEARLLAHGAGPRQIVRLDSGWEYLRCAEAGLPAPPAGQWQTATVPGRLDASSTEHHIWYRCSLEIPGEVAGVRLKLHFGAVNHAARVFVNTRLTGEHFGGNLPFEVDITDDVHPGANDLWVEVTDWTAACTSPPATFEVGPFENPGWKLPLESIIAPIGADFRLTGIRQSVSLVVCTPVQVQDVFVRTSVRQRRLAVAVTIRNESNAPCAVQMANDIADRDGPALSLPAATVTVAPGEVREVHLEAAWEAPHLWSLDDPHLYRLTTALTEGGRELDRVATRFGFREVWTEGPRFVLNGVPLKLFATSGWSMETWEAARDHIARMKRAGTRCMRLHTQPWQGHILDAADEVGMLIVDEAAVYCFQQAYAAGEKRFWENYAEHLRGLARRDRNHPSLVMYSLENEILLCGADPLRWETQLGRLSDLVREVDPTRLITCEADLDPAGKMDVIGMHYPREYWNGFTLYPGKCWWMDEPITYLGRPWKWQRDKPLYIGEFDGGFPAWYPQYQAFWLGDEAYTFPGRFSAVSPNSRARREMIQAEVAAYRAYGVTGLNPWFDPDEVDVFGPKAYAPLMLAVREQTHSFYSGDLVRRTVCVYNDSSETARVALRWRLAGPGDQGTWSAEQITLAPCTVAERRVTLRLPQVRERTPAKLLLRLERNGQVVYETEQGLGAFPRPVPRPSPDGMVLYDPSGTTARALKGLGLSATPLEDLRAIPAQARAVIIGRAALSAGQAPWARALAAFVAAGGAVVCLEQEEYPQQWLPLDVELDANQATTIAFPRAVGHPALAGVMPDDLRFWNPDHLVAQRSLLKPWRGNFIPVVDAGGIRGAIDDLNGLSWAPLLELPYGRGRYLLSQLLLVAKVDTEPTAARLLTNLVRYAATARPNTPGGRAADQPAPRGAALLTGPDSSLKAALDGLAVVYDKLPDTFARKDLDAYRVLIAGGGQDAWDPLRARAVEVREWVEGGGVLWLDNLSPTEADVLRALLGAKCELRPADVAPMQLADRTALTSGLSNHELYWRDRPIWDQWTAMRRIMEFEPVGLPSAAVALTEPPGLTQVPVGRGTVLVNQLLWHSTDQNRLEGLRIASVLLTNLGVEMDLSTLGPVDEDRFRPVSIAAWCNLGFAGDPAGGWMDHGPDALAAFPLGHHVLARVPLTIVDPAANGGKSVIALRGTARPGYPVQVAGIPVNLTARALLFLHTCAWGGAAGTEAAAYVVHYADGSERRIALRVGTEIADWYADPVALPEAQVAWTGQIADKPGPIGVYVMRWVNPYPEKVVSSLDFVSAGGGPVPVLIAVSAELQP